MPKLVGGVEPAVGKTAEEWIGIGDDSAEFNRYVYGGGHRGGVGGTSAASGLPQTPLAVTPPPPPPPAPGKLAVEEELAAIARGLRTLGLISNEV